MCNFDAIRSFEKQNVTMRVNMWHETAVLVKPSHILLEKMSSGVSDVLRLLCLNSVIHRGSWKQHVGCLQTKAVTAGGCWGQLTK